MGSGTGQGEGEEGVRGTPGHLSVGRLHRVPVAGNIDLGNECHVAVNSEHHWQALVLQ